MSITTKLEAAGLLTASYRHAIVVHRAAQPPIALGVALSEPISDAADPCVFVTLNGSTAVGYESLEACLESVAGSWSETTMLAAVAGADPGAVN